MSLTKVSYSMIQGEAVNVLDFNGDIQAAINYACPLGKKVKIPSGTYTINANLTLPSKVGNPLFNVCIEGDGYSSRIICGAAVTKAFDFGQTDVETVAWASISGLRITANAGGSGTTAYASRTAIGISIPHITHSRFINLSIELFGQYGMFLGNDQEGYCNYFEDVTTIYCKVGLYADGAFNDNHFNHCRFWLNEIGYAQAGGYATVLTNCLFEANAKTGFIARVVEGLSINGCYFELNGSIAAGQFPATTTAGMTLTTPAITIYASMIFDGGGTGFPYVSTMAYFSPIQGARVDACFVAPSGSKAAGNTFIYAYAGQNIDVSNCTNFAANPVPVIKTYQNASYAGLIGININNNNGFSDNIQLENNSAGANFSSLILPSLNASTADNINYANSDLLNWVATMTAFPASWQRKNILDENGRAVPVFEIYYSNVAGSGFRNFSVNAANFPKNIGKLFAFSLDYKVQAVGVSITIYATDNPDGYFTPVDTDWKTYSGYFIWPASGTLNFGVAKINNVNSVYVTNPILQEVGASYAEANAAFTKQTIFRYDVAPTVGDWLLGDTVINSIPVSGQPAGWMCTVAGTPGTWKAMANLA